MSSKESKDAKEAPPVRERTKSVTESVRKSLGRLQSIKLPKFGAPKVPKVTGGLFPKKAKAEEEVKPRVAAPELPENFPSEYILWVNTQPRQALSTDILKKAKATAAAKDYIKPEKKNEVDEAFEKGELSDMCKSLLNAIGVGRFNRILKPLLVENNEEFSLAPFTSLRRGCKLIIYNSVIAPSGDFNWFTNDSLEKAALTVEELPELSILQLHGNISDPTSLFPVAPDVVDNPAIMEFLKDSFTKYPVCFVGGDFQDGTAVVDILKDIAVHKDEDDNVRRNIAMAAVGEGKPEEVDIDLKFLEYTPDEHHTQIWEFIAKLAVKNQDDNLVLGETKYLPIDSDFDPLPNSKAVFKWSSKLPLEWLKQEMESIAAKDDFTVRLLINEAGIDEMTAANKGDFQAITDFVAKHGYKKMDIRITQSTGKSNLFFFRKKLDGKNIQHGIISVEDIKVIESFKVKKVEVHTRDVLKQVARFEENWVAAKDAIPYITDAINKLGEKPAKEEDVAAPELSKEEKLKQKKEEQAKKKEEAKLAKEAAAKKKAEEKKQKKEEALKKKEQKKKELAEKKEEAKKQKEAALTKKAEEAKKQKEAALAKKGEEEPAPKKEEAASKKEEPKKEEAKPAAEEAPKLEAAK